MGSAKPQIAVAQALALAREHWGLAAEGPDCCVGLAGYDDANFRITGKAVMLLPPPPPLPPPAAAQPNTHHCPCRWRHALRAQGPQRG